MNAVKVAVVQRTERFYVSFLLFVCLFVCLLLFFFFHLTHWLNVYVLKY